MPYCMACGAEIQPEDRFCPSCGAEVEGAIEATSKNRESNITYGTSTSRGKISSDQTFSESEDRSGMVPDNSKAKNESKPSVLKNQSDSAVAIDLLSRGWEFLSTNPAAFAVFAVAGIFQLVGGVVGGVLQALFGVAAGIIVAIGSGVIIYGIPTVATGERFDLEALIRRTFTQLVVAVIAGFISSVLISIGLLLLIIPGIFLMLKFAFVAQYVYLENTGPVEALQKSWGRTQSQLLPIFLVFLAIALPSVILGFVPVVGQPIGTIVLIPIGIAALTHLYLTLEEEPGAMTSEMDRTLQKY